jgi:ketosteroid isomerase-like protein
VSERSEQLRDAFAALNRGSSAEFETLFAPDGRWLGVPGSGIDGATPI